MSESDRDATRRALRAAIARKRATRCGTDDPGPAGARPLSAAGAARGPVHGGDVATALLQLGIDDAALLNRVTGASSSLELRNALSSALVAAQAATAAAMGTESDDEDEAPPPIAE
jgi:hypothetical protein